MYVKVDLYSVDGNMCFENKQARGEKDWIQPLNSKIRKNHDSR